MIKTIQVPKTVMEDRLQCDKCGETFHIAELLVAEEHAKKHQQPRYFNGWSTVVWLTEGVMVRQGKGWGFDHRSTYYRDSRFPIMDVVWSGEGWYDIHEYEVQYHGCDRETRYEMRPIQFFIDEAKEQIKDAAEKLKRYREIARYK